MIELIEYSLERAEYYLNLLIALCGFDGTDDSVFFGWSIVGISALIVIYAFYEAITKAIWPGETNKDHVKYQIFDDGEEF